jgi:phosphomevalonate kinase
VLDPAYSGIVVSTSSRFYTAISYQPSPKPGVVRVRSPQFLEATWLFSVSLDPDVVIKPLQENTSKNKFVHLALQHTLSLAVEIKGLAAIQKTLANGLDITIVGDNDFLFTTC